MLSWNLWRSLQNPPLKHPIFRRANKGTAYDSAKSRHSTLVFALFTLLMVILVSKLLHINTLVVLVSLPILLIMLVMVSPLLLPFVIFCFGAYIATRISHAVFMEKQNATYDLLHLPPVQTIRADWTLAIGVLYRNHAFELLNNAVQFTLFGVSIVIFIIIAVFWSTGYTIVLVELVNMLVLLALFYTGFIQSLVLSMILGLLVPQYAANVEQNNLSAVFAYIVIQGGTYLVALLIGFGLLPTLYSSLNLANHWAELTLILWQLLLIYIIREGVNALLWRYLVYTLNSDKLS